MRGRRRRGRLLSAACAALVAVPLLTAVPSAAAPVGPSPSTDPAPAGTACDRASEENPVLVEVTRLLPRAPMRPDEPFQVTGTLRNCGESAIEDLQVRLAVGPVIRTRGELQRADDEPVVGPRKLTAPAGSESLAPGGTAGFDLRLLVGELDLDGGLGVYPLALQARGRYGDDASRTTLGLATTFVPWFPDGPPSPTRIAWLWPLVDQPRRAPREVMLDDVLDALVAPGDERTPRGRLQELLVGARVGSQGGCEQTAAPPPGTPRPPSLPCRGEPVPVTYGIDPSLLYSIEAMVAPGGYTVLVDGEEVDLPKSQNAEQWLVGLRAEATAGADVLALPFGDPDVAAMARVGSGLRDDVEALRKLGQAEVVDKLGVEPLAAVAWPPPGELPAPALDVLAGGQTRAVVLDETALPPASVARNRTPNARTELPSAIAPVSGLVVEDVLSELVEYDPERWQGPRLAEQRFLAETAIIAAELPSESRTLLVAPDRTARVVPAVAAAVIADTGRLPWLCPVPLADVVAGQEACATLPDPQAPAEAEARGDGAPDGRVGELDRSFLERLAQVMTAADQFTEAVLVDGTEPSADTKARLLRAEGRAASAAWRDEPLEGRIMLDLLEDDVRRLREQVRLVSQPVLLTGSSGVIELAVQNELSQPVNVGVRLDETSAARLSSSGTDVQVIPAGRAVPVRVEVEPRTSGRFQIVATLVDEEGRPFGGDVRLDVRSTQYGRVALAVTGVAAAVLLVAAGARITRRALRRRPA